MIDQHYHIVDSEEESGVNEVEVYWNADSNIVIKDSEEGYFSGVVVITPEMANDLIQVLGKMVNECDD